MITDTKFFARIANMLEASHWAIKYAWQWQNQAAYFNDNLRERDLHNSSAELSRSKKLLKSAREQLGGNYFTEEFEKSLQGLETLMKLRRDTARDIRNRIDYDILNEKTKNFMGVADGVRDSIYAIECKVRHGNLD